MITRAQIEKVLQINGLPVSASDEEIQAVLTNSRWHKNDIASALVVLRQPPPTTTTTHSPQSDIFTSDDVKLSPDTISSLLGIDMTIEAAKFQERQEAVEQHSALTMVAVICLTIFSAALLVFTLMWHFKTGIFFVSV